MSVSNSRFDQLLNWLQVTLELKMTRIEPASSDASFRRYFRVYLAQESRIVMDAPPPQENVRPFVNVAGLMREAGLQTPGIHAVDAERGFLLLDDLGNRSYLDVLTTETADRLYADAIEALVRLQQGVSIESAGLPHYDFQLLTRELGIFREWLLENALSLTLSPDEERMLAATWEILVESALEQPKVCVHRDYHCRNLMVTDQQNPGVLDFQDAVVGPITYDLVSLLRDCYIAWPDDQVQMWVEKFRQTVQRAGRDDVSDASQFRRWFDLMGMQRHLKAAGIFVRLKLRDGKTGYLKDIPRTLGYVAEAGKRYPELREFADFVERRVMPELDGMAP